MNDFLSELNWEPGGKGLFFLEEKLRVSGCSLRFLVLWNFILCRFSSRWKSRSYLRAWGSCFYSRVQIEGCYLCHLLDLRLGVVFRMGFSLCEGGGVRRWNPSWEMLFFLLFLLFMLFLLRRLYLEITQLLRYLPRLENEME